jgi:hypothetical protein
MSTTRRFLARVRTRLLLACAVEDLERGLAFGAGAALVGLAAARLGAPAFDAARATYAGLAVAVAFPVVGAFARRRDDRAVAAIADERLGLRERLSTALWFQTTPSPAAADLGPLVVADALATAQEVRGDALTRAFRPRFLRRPALVAAVLVAATFGLSLFGERAQAVMETEAERVTRLADADRVNEVARKLRDEAKRVGDEAAKHKEDELAKVADEVRRKTDPMTRAPAPPRHEALKQLGALADLAREKARRAAGMKETSDAKEAVQEDKALEELLQSLSNAGLESLQRDLASLEKRLKEGDKGQDAPTASEVRDLAKRLDSLRKAMERAQGADAEKLAQQLRSFGNEALVAKIAERMRQLAARMDRGESYENLQSEGGSEEMDLSKMSEEELQELLDQIDQLAGMKDLEQLLREGGGELAGGRKMRIEGTGGT